MGRAVSWRGRQRALAAGMAALVAIGAMAVAPAAPATAAPLTASADSPGPPAHLPLQVGNVWGFVFTGGSPSTGYSWRFSLTQTSEVVRISRTVVSSPNRGLIGQPDLEVLAVAAVHPGVAVLMAKLMPPGQDTPVETHRIHIMVAP